MRYSIHYYGNIFQYPLQVFLTGIHYRYPLGSPMKLTGYPKPSISAASIRNEAWANTGLKIKLYRSQNFFNKIK